MRCLITGATGFAGRHLADVLRAAGHHVEGLARHSADAPFPIHLADLCDPAATESILRTTRPDWVFHLAGYAHAGKSFTDPDGAWAGNLTTSRGFYLAIHKSGLKPRVLH